MIRGDGLRRSFGGRVALAGLDLTVEPGEVVALMGPNGAGKTTTLRLLLGLLAPDAGTVTVTRPVGYQPERFRPATQLDVRAVLRVAATARGASADEVGAVVERFELGEQLARPVGRLSRGQLQRVGLAQAFLGRPRTLLLDEPTGGLDPAQVGRLRGAVRDAAADGTAVLLATHVTGDVARTCDRAVILRAGEHRAEVPVTSAVALERAWVDAVTDAAAAVEDRPGGGAA